MTSHCSISNSNFRYQQRNKSKCHTITKRTRAIIAAVRRYTYVTTFVSSVPFLLQILASLQPNKDKKQQPLRSLLRLFPLPLRPSCEYNLLKCTSSLMHQEV
jgi:hypothetical protein